MNDAANLARRMLGRTVKLGGELTAFVEGVSDVGEASTLFVRWDHSNESAIVKVSEVTWVQGEPDE